MTRHQFNNAVHCRMNVALLSDDGPELRRIADALYLDEGAIAEHRRCYEAEGRARTERLIVASIYRIEASNSNRLCFVTLTKAALGKCDGPPYEQNGVTRHDRSEESIKDQR